ncbi:Zinc finger BED domain-containing protein [Quillaja saponaria]|uniref:Zinc finger BED domain-containing protein n=1 Tax=Quillaja saponaria TaxID=32244 RepID=A0AAD7PQ31_QUISA|nr:Zinc finger BED domain-containing protein [Quillaja saponaria]
MATEMIVKFDKYWFETCDTMAVATILDPRYKMKLIEFNFSKLFGKTHCAFEVDRIRRVCCNLVDEYQANSRDGFSQPSGSSQDMIDVDCQDSLSDYDMFILNERKSKRLKLQSELDQYLDEDVIPRRKYFDVLLLWKLNGIKYPILQAIARDFLAIPMSTVASESAFSTSGRLISPYHSRLNPETVEALMCAQNWLWTVEGDEVPDSYLDDAEGSTNT